MRAKRGCSTSGGGFPLRQDSQQRGCFESTQHLSKWHVILLCCTVQVLCWKTTVKSFVWQFLTDKSEAPLLFCTEVTLMVNVFKRKSAEVQKMPIMTLQMLTCNSLSTVSLTQKSRVLIHFIYWFFKNDRLILHIKVLWCICDMMNRILFNIVYCVLKSFYTSYYTCERAEELQWNIYLFILKQFFFSLWTYLKMNSFAEAELL